MGFHSEKQLEQDELDAFVNALYMGHTDPDDLNYTPSYGNIPWEMNARTVRDKRTGRYLAKVEGIDYHWNESTIVFADDGGFHKPMVITTTAEKAV